MVSWLQIAVAQQTHDRLRIVFAGDLMGHMPLHHAALQADGSYNYEPCFRHVKDYISSADIAIVNLEVTLGGKPYTGYPCFSAPDALAIAARDAGFDVFTTANNHCMDKGAFGLRRTINVLDSSGILHLGTYPDRQSRIRQHPLILEQNGFRIALLCYTYGTNGITVPKPLVVNDIDTIQMALDIQSAKLKKADFIIALMHWGVEYQKHSNSEQESIARFLFRNGCDAVIGGHPHVVQNLTADLVPDDGMAPQVVAYSMGNFLSNQKDESCDGGIMIELELEKKNDIVSVRDCHYMPYWVHKLTVNGRRQYQIIPSSDAVAHPDSYSIASEDMIKLRAFDNSTRQRVEKGQSDKAMKIEERFYYDNKCPESSRSYTYYYLDYDNDFGGCPNTEPVYVSLSNNQLTVQRTSAVANPVLAAYKYLHVGNGHLTDSDDYFTMRRSHSTSAVRYIQWDTITSNEFGGICKTVINKDTFIVAFQRDKVSVTPAPVLHGLPGIVLSVIVNGRTEMMLRKEE